MNEARAYDSYLDALSAPPCSGCGEPFDRDGTCGCANRARAGVLLPHDRCACCGSIDCADCPESAEEADITW